MREREGSTLGASTGYALEFGLKGILSFVILCYQVLSFDFIKVVKDMSNIDKWLTLEELASYLKLGRTKLYGMTQRGEIPASKIGNQWRFDREEIDQWMKSHATGKGVSKA